MSRIYSHVNTAKTILTIYNGEIPLSAFLKKFFSAQKKYGSRDRRTISAWCYFYFRTGFMLERESIEERLLTGLFLCTDAGNELFKTEKPAFDDKATLPLIDKLAFLHLDAQKIFPFINQLSEGINAWHFSISFLIQPDVFIRIRPQKQEMVKQKLVAAQMPFKEMTDTCFAFASGTKIDQILDLNREVIIQDLNSQKTAELFRLISFHKSPAIWDCCAASGGKSIMAYDFFPEINLTISDIRPSIIKNLHSRFKEAGIKNYTSFIADLTNLQQLEKELQNQKFTLIICDAPCSGSGTWSRTPEQLSFFKEEQIKKYSDLQKSICTNAIKFLEKDGYFLYITCSVFKKENEEVAAFINQKCGLTLIKTELLKGYDDKADSLFAALFVLS